MKWNYIGVVARIVLQFGVQVGLARMLGPDAFGIFALAFLVVGAGNIVVELGLGSALIQKRQISERDVRHVYTLSVCIGVILTVITFAAAPLFASLLDESRVAAVLRGLAPAFLLQALAVTPMALLKRELNFKRVQAAVIGSYVLGYGVIGVGSAYLGAGVWSLVGAWLVQAASLAASTYLMRRHSMRPLLMGGDAALRGFGFKIFLTNVFNWSVENLDNLLVGRFFGAKALGLYSVSYNLVRAPATHLVTSLQATLFAAASRAQDNEQGLRRAYLVALSCVALAAIPMFSGLVGVAPTFVQALLGAKWAGAEVVLRPLALAMAAHALMAVAGPVLWGKGDVGIELRLQALTAVVLAAALFLVRSYSVGAMAWAVFGVYLFRLLLITVALASRLQLAAGDLWRSVRGGVIASCVIAPAIFLFDAGLAGFAPVTRLAATIILAAAMLLAFLLVFPRVALPSEALELLRTVVSSKLGLSTKANNSSARI